MFLFEIASWLVLSFVFVGIHLFLSPRPHEKPGLAILTAVMWGMTGGLLGTVIGLREADAGYSVLSLILAGVATLSFLGLEWASGHEHAGRTAHR
jgi:FtsH-binding integral membrane protein